MSFIAKKLGGVIYQSLNEYGKCVFLHFQDYNISMSVHPQAPFDYPIGDKFYTATVEQFTTFLKTYNTNEDMKLSVRYQDVKGGKLVGIWIDADPLPYPYYIFVEFDRPLNKFERAPDHFLAPGKSLVEESLIDKEHKLKTLSIIFREYTYAIAARDPDNFSVDNSFEIVNDHEYDIDNVRHRIDMTNNNLVYNGKLIVPSREIAERLYNHALIMKTNDPIGFRRYITHTFIQQDLQSIMDFDVQEDVTIFSEKFHISDFIEAKKNNNTRDILTEFPEKQKLAVVYGPSRVQRYRKRDGSLLGPCILQFVKNDSQLNALTVCAIWNDDDNINIGYYPSADTRNNYESVKERISSIHIFDVRNNKWTPPKKDSDKRAYLVQFGEKQFAALLPLVHSEL